MKRMIIAVFVTLGLCSDLTAGSIYKCTDAAGNVSFSQTACQRNEVGDEIGYSEPSATPQTHVQKIYANPTPMEQVRQLERDKERKAIKRQQRQLDQERRERNAKIDKLNEQSYGQKRKIEQKKCALYRSYARDSERRSATSYRYWDLKAAEHCGR